VVLDVAQLQALLAKTFDVGLDVGRGKEPVALVRLRLAKALVGVAEANALAAARAMAIVTGLAAVEPDPRAPDNDVLLDAAVQAATGLAQLLRFRGACATADSAAEREAATACLL
jgi:hypothetical protein